MIDLQVVAREIFEKLLSYLDEETAMDLLEEIIDLLEDGLDRLDE